MTNTKFNPPEFYERLARTYPEEAINKDTESIRHLDEFVHSFLDRVKGPLLDFGCGQGRYSCYYKNGKVWGVDIAPTNVKVATVRSKVLKDGVERHFITADITKPTKFSGFQNIICIEVLEHIPDWGCVVDNIYNALALNGTVLVTTPPAVKDGWIKSAVLSEFGITDEYFHGGYSPETLKERFATKLTVVEFGYVPAVMKSFVKAVKL